MRRIESVLLLLLTAPAARAGSPESDAAFANFGIAVLMSCGFLVLLSLLLVSLNAFAFWRGLNPPTRRNKSPPAGSEQPPSALPPFPRQGP